MCCSDNKNDKKPATGAAAQASAIDQARVPSTQEMPSGAMSPSSTAGGMPVGGMSPRSIVEASSTGMPTGAMVAADSGQMPTGEMLALGEPGAEVRASSNGGMPNGAMGATAVGAQAATRDPERAALQHPGGNGSNGGRSRAEAPKRTPLG
jgi:hypothetical protein